ncbi:hypothetical protein HZF05_18505 [Sphingomonas sp. CGMCC 1.13654]|uniref:Uncharacterized protein n=1 Tax=Sphingomonas chungangi TaxID=2683589 RepID=A0A838LF68_9SPHN|nr:hypothetical protein [Sphingomonas chungangi]MBA2936078.1 hypothetical protein [Sphingomonas chungangi]MVW55466.1 hypothetical protein [Sphingomonas chungangi]
MNWRRLLGFDRRSLIALALIAVPAAAVAKPSLLSWGWHGQFGRYDVYADVPPAPQLQAELARSSTLLGASPIDDRALRPTLYLTDGGWRWHLLALTNDRAFAVTRPMLGGTVVNRSDIASDTVFARGYRRTLSGVVAHETVHVLQRERLGLVGFARLPTWVKEGYADYVARESTLSDADVARLRAQGRDDPAIFYHDARLRVSDALTHGETVDQLLRSTS